MKRTLCISLFLMSLLVSVPSAAKMHAKFYSYHDKAPYHAVRVSDSASGIYQQVVDYLNARQSDYEISLEYVPRQRLEQRLELGELDGAVIGVSPVWFKDKAQKKFLWSEPIMKDRDVVISRKDALLNYKKNDDLIGIRMALPRGLYFWGITELVNQGKIPVYKTDSDRQSFVMLLNRKASATITSILTYRVLSKDMESGDTLEIQNKPHDQFFRRLLFPKKLENFKQTVDPLINGMMTDDDWLSILESYGYER